MLGCMNLHPKNTGFRWRDPVGPFELLTKDQVRSFCNDGGLCLEGMFTAEEITAVVDAIDPLEAQAEAMLASREDGRFGIARAGEITFSPHLVARSEVLAEFSRHPRLVQLVQELIGGVVRLYWDQLVYKKGGTVDEFPWHQDNGYTYVEPQQYLTCWVALTDATQDNGCPWIAPGVHLQGTLEHRWTDLGFECLNVPEQARPMPLKAGSVAVFSSLTPHRTGPNLTASTRKAYILQYAPDGAMMYPHNGSPEAADNGDWQYVVASST